MIDPPEKSAFIYGWQDNELVNNTGVQLYCHVVAYRVAVLNEFDHHCY